jgi:hypothetical protein
MAWHGKNEEGEGEGGRALDEMMYRCLTYPVGGVGSVSNNDAINIANAAMIMNDDAIELPNQSIEWI